MSQLDRGGIAGRCATPAGARPGGTGAGRRANTLVSPASTRRVFVAMAGAVVIVPLLGAIAAVWLAVDYGVSWLALVMFAIAYVLTTLGVTLGFHRYFAHRSFRTSPPMRVAFIILGSMALQGSLLYWVSTHRRHHQFSDTPDDPHSPHMDGLSPLGWWRGLWHSHIGWMFAAEVTNAVRFAPDIIRDPLVFRTQLRYLMWAGLGLALPAVVAAGLTRSWYGMLEAFLWAGPVRLFVVHHASWAVGSVSHMYGSRPFVTHDHSANNFWVALLAFGEGLQNNHHAFPAAARHAFRWWEPDLTGYVISSLAATKVIWDVVRPSAETVAQRRPTASIGSIVPGA